MPKLFDENKQADGHYYATSFANWVVGKSLAQVTSRITKADKETMAPERYTVYFVPLPIKSAYEIDGYAPQVPDTLYIGRFNHNWS